jgi:outer membrane protein
MKFISRFILAVLFLLFFSTSSFALGLEVAVGGWAQSPSGQLGYQPPFDSLDLESDLGYDDETPLFARVKLDLPILPNFYFMATPMEFEGNGSKIFSFGGASFNQPFYSKTTMDHYDVAMYFEVPLLETASLNTFNIEFGIDVRMLEVDMTIRELAPGAAEQFSESLVFPMLYLGFQFKPVDSLAFEVEFFGSEYNDNSYYDFIGRVKYNFTGPVFLSAGYRIEQLEIDDSGILADLEFSGPFAEAGLDF